MSIKEKLQRKVIALLAYLATEQRPHNREHLMELFWPEIGTEAARTNLRGAIYRLRKSLGNEQLLLVSRDTLSLAPDKFQLDLKKFMTPPAANANCSELEKQLTLYRGQFLDGISLEYCDSFEGWLGMKREVCHRHALGLAARLRDMHLQQHDTDQAIRAAHRVMELEPWDEENHRQLMYLLAISGRPNEAMRQFEMCRQLLHKEFDIEPDAETAELYRKIKSGEFNAQPALPAQAPKTARSERRQITALYCHIDFPPITDPDERLECSLATRQRCMEIIRRYGGYIYQPHGSAIFTYFGYPIASEDAALRAVRAALALAKLNDTNTRIRSGLHTGITISSDQLPDEMGTTTSLALELLNTNAPVTISETTLHLVEGYFQVWPAGEYRTTGGAQPLNTYHVTAESDARTPLEASARLTPLVGRKTEIQALLGHWRQVNLKGTGRFLLLGGEAGIGKSRLLQTLKNEISKQEGLIRELRCFPEFQQSPYYPLIRLLESLCDISTANSSDDNWKRLEANSRRLFPRQEKHTLPLLAQLLALGETIQIDLPAEQQKEAIHSLLLHLLDTLAAKHPQVCIIEDLHWADPSTLELLEQYVGRKSNTPLFMVFSARPDFTPRWELRHVTSLLLQPLDRDDAIRIISAIDAGISPDTVRNIVARADGIPLYVEEMAKVAASTDGEIPTKLHDLLAARLDQAGSARQTALLAATIGREFNVELLGKASPRAPETLQQDLHLLQQAGLVIPLTPTRQHFKHALIQEAIYQSQTRSDRQKAHRQIAQALLDYYPEVVSGRPEQVAHHLAEAGQTEQAIDYWLKAGQRAAWQSANLEARENFNTALQLLTRLPQTAQRDNTEFTILGQLCPVLYAATGYGSDEATRANTRLVELGSRVNNQELFLPKWAQVLNTICNTRGHKQHALATALELPDLAQGNPVKEVATQYALGLSNFWLGQFEATRLQCEKAMSVYRPEFHSSLVEHFGDDLFVNAASFSACAHCFLGYPEQARRICTRMIDHARSAPHPHTLAVALSWSAFVHRWLDMPAETMALSNEILELSGKHDFAVWFMVGESTKGWAQIMLGDSSGEHALRSSIEKMRTTVAGVPVLFKSPFVAALIHLHRYEDALHLVNEALVDSNATGECFFDAELHRLKGESLLGLADRKQAEACFRKALEISCKQRAKFLELRAATSLAFHWNQMAPLKAVYSKFSEGFDTLDLIKARDILEAEGRL